MLREFSMRRFLGILTTALLAMSGACHDFDSTRVNVPRGTIGEEVFGVFCDRVAGQSLREDMSGSSFRGVCHKQGGAYTDQVDERGLPPPQEGLRNKEGNAVPLDEQKAVRARSVARINALARRRAELIEALDFMFPDADVQTLDIKNRDPKATCSDSGRTRALGLELADMLSRFTELYNDDT